MEDGINSLVDFIQDLFPLVQDQQPMPTSPLQRLVASDLDHYLPFRNLAPTRCAVTSDSGPFHPMNVTTPGAFASCVISRALTFNTPAVKDQGNPTLFRDQEEWDAFKARRDFHEDDPTSLAYFFNPTCYGTAQYTRWKGMVHVSVYYAEEISWQELRQKHAPKPIPFVAFYRWTKQSVPRLDVKTGKQRQQSRLPLVGKLTAFLLAADMSYTGLVEPPTAEEVGRLIHQIGLGSRSGMVQTRLIGSERASQAEVVDAFVHLVAELRERVDTVTQRRIGLDEIMVEHLLCKFQRVRRDLSSSKGKKVCRIDP